MKKKILSLILALVFIPSIFMFAGCKDKGYKLVDLVKDYEKIGTKCENIKVVDNKIEFDYDVHTIGETGYLTECVNEIAPYTEIADYNILLDNLMGFVYENIDVCSNANIEAGAEIIVLCSSDDEYAEFAPAAFKALAGRAEFVVAGAPACMEDLKAQGIDQFINVKSNVLETLKAFNTKLGIA